MQQNFKKKRNIKTVKDFVTLNSVNSSKKMADGQKFKEF